MLHASMAFYVHASLTHFLLILHLISSLTTFSSPDGINIKGKQLWSNVHVCVCFCVCARASLPIRFSMLSHVNSFIR